jgi:hypothetical protein
MRSDRHAGEFCHNLSAYVAIDEHHSLGFR